MQLKMSKSFNVGHVKQLLQNEDAFITELFAKMPVSISQSGEHEDQEQQTGSSLCSSTKGKTFATKGEKKRAQTFEELHARLEELKGVKKLDYKQKLLKKGFKNRIKKKSKKELYLNKKLSKVEQPSSGLHKVHNDTVEGPKVPRPKPVFNSDGKMVFSKFDFSETDTTKRIPKVDKDPKKILQHLKWKKEKLKELEQTGEKEKVIELKEKEAWKAALVRSSGEKVKDDPQLLKKTIQKQEQRKKQSSKKWGSRLEAVQKLKQDKQGKRQENIAKRKKEKKLNKMKKAAKKGHVIPGL